MSANAGHAIVTVHVEVSHADDAIEAAIAMHFRGEVDWLVGDGSARASYVDNDVEVHFVELYERLDDDDAEIMSRTQG
jgi:hypothetical protein